MLVCDDQVDVLEAIRLLLKGAGHQTETVDSPRSALAACDRQPFDLILSAGGSIEHLEATARGSGDMDGLLDSIMQDVQHFSPGQQFDDVTVVALQGR